MLTPVTYERFVDEVMRHTGLQDRAAAEHACLMTMRVLSARLSAYECETVADHLPEPLSGELQSRDFEGWFGKRGLFQRVTRLLPGVDREFGMEQAQAVCATIGKAVKGEARELLGKLPHELRELFFVERPGVTETPLHDTQDHTLAAGHGGGDDPLYEARADRAQSGSVASDDDPHGDRKLSSGDREHTLSTGQPPGR